MIRYFCINEQGRVVKKGTCIEVDLAANTAGYYAYYEGEINELAEYVVNGQKTPRPSFNLTVSYFVESNARYIRVENIPAGTTVVLPDQTVIVDDGYLEWTATDPGSYPIHFSNFPYLEETIDATITII